MREMVMEMVDEILDTEPVNIAGISFSRSRILFELDPIRYSQIMDDVIDSLVEDLEYELEHLDEDNPDYSDEVNDIKERIESLREVTL